MRIGIVGGAGRMGQMLIREVLGSKGAILAGATERPGNPALGRDLGTLVGLDEAGVVLTDDAAALFAAADAVIDFTAPAATLAHADLAVAHGTALIVGTTGLSAEDHARLAQAAAKAPLVVSANFSLGVTLLAGLVRKVAATLGPDWDIEIVEMHHKHKVDAPSGTALALGRAAAEGRGVDLATVKDAVRDGHTGARKPGDIGFATLRGGDVVGDHTVMFATEAERLELSHKAGSRAIFARGAVRAALWVAGKPAGLYNMDDVLGL
ncbi:4-hydroxy-tetrahydrodipicolinate reductase [Niveispirillum sp. SYP-B3756]|uniref:4-hydroxy-tetrahydrodipicolinate reductase n=1 Tax=Niveispirillum sp. SYP-B3756 TaxID=2662178 RepID=UPI0012925F41|nr:4-hydroxy-tetrahydrodipicolinate reductase [Niveispirillum sp. SYP-B3756]MQP65666.1 4-hydroxy-tetrahydrodipicolinate reductase [Niveispirillum sp. SYP-B3756]